jgi:ribosomal protein S27E
MGQKFNKINGKYAASVICPDCGIEHLISHKNYYAQQSFRCASCGRIFAAKKRRNPKLTKTTHGYIKLYRPENPMADKRGEVYEHRLVMSAILGRPLESWEIVHHKGIRHKGIENRSDNLEDNLELHPNTEHITIIRLQTRVKQLEDILKQHHIPIS